MIKTFVKNLWLDIEIVIEDHEHQVALDTIGAGPQYIIIHIFTRQRVSNGCDGLSLAQELADKRITIVITNNPDDTMHEVD